jgi:hypothetical protein
VGRRDLERGMGFSKGEGREGREENMIRYCVREKD